MVDVSVDFSRDRGLWALSDRVVRGVLAIEPPPSVLDLDALLSVETGPPPRAWVDASARTLEALLIAHSRLDDVAGARELVETHFREGRLRVPGSLRPSTRSTLLAAVSEVYSAAGSPRQAGLYAAAAIVYAANPTALYRAHAVRALAYALNGEHALAEQAIEHCRQIARDAGWSAVYRDYCLLLAEILFASAAMDAPALARLAAEMRETAPDDLFWQYTARTADAMRALLEREYGNGLALLTTLVGGADALNSHAMVRGFALGVFADTLLARGEARRALALLDGAESPNEHALCYGMQRGAAYLVLGRDRSVLETTDSCIALGAEHCVRTLVPVLLRRAIALLRLKNQAAALNTFDEAFALCESLGDSLAPFITLPMDAVEELLDMLLLRRPAAVEMITRMRTGLRSVPTRAVPERLPALSPREERVAMLLRGSLNVSQIADELKVSLNTVKTQLRSIYTKLDVSTREDAVSVLESQGFFL